MAFVSVHGYIGRDPELRSAGSSQVLSFSIADKGFIASKDVEAPAQWYRVEVWGKEGERLSSILSKGSEVVISGQLIQRPYKGKNGEALSLDIKAAQVGFAGKKAQTEEVPF